MIRESVASDIPTLLAVARQTGAFRPIEITALNEVLTDFHTTNHAHGHRAVTYDDDGQIIGFAYYAPAAMTDRSWYVYWIAVHNQAQGRGIGTELMQFAEEDIRKRNGRVLFVETSSLPDYEATRGFYDKRDYERVADLSDYYADGDDMVVFRKRLQD